MLFSFLKYLQPTHYFQLRKFNKKSVFPCAYELPEEVLSQLKPDTRFVSKHAVEYDLSWQSIQCGYIGDVETYSDFETLSIQDNYHFIRKYFHKAWVVYVLLLRLFSLRNPIIELKAFWKTRHIERRSIDTSIPYKSWSNFVLKKDWNPLVSIVIPTLNRYTFLKDVLHDLEQQDYNNFEIIVVDQSEPFQPSFYEDFNLKINLLRQEEKALWLARNIAIKNAKGELIALSEDDVRVQPDWISSHLKCLRYFDAKVSAGVFYPQGQQMPKTRSFFAVASQFATGNAMLYRQVFKQVGLFDRQFEKQRMGDGEFGLRLFLEGLRCVSNPYASCVDIKAGTGGLREMGSWDAFRTTSLWAPRPIPSVLYFFRTYFGTKASKLALLRNIPQSIIPYTFKKNKAMQLIGVFYLILVLPLVCYQVMKSWSLSTKKINKGPLIGTLS